ncbi:tetratricopeptide repeat protein [Cochleicola gelatinilyticus]|uniref:Uncharacterized protein n=1 Tax=Cochleicola gelatinilyticus TaxID=1763537 RepID=A0A167HIT1_9FLAO|nr:tetratricopeptide repeat protein [Cochleicola gelatinilyticus]OAB78655.1 hypothetical protein ULVI_08715 [Cochleicola gelatinilyticus]
MFAQTPSQVDSLLLKAVLAREQKQFTESLEYLTKARAIAEEQQWYKQEFLAINNIGAYYYSMLDYGEALDNYLEAYTIAIKRLDENEEMIVLNNIAILYSKEGDSEKATEYFEKAYTLAKEANDNLKIGLYSVNLGIVANELKKPDLAFTYLEQALPLLTDHPNIYLLAEIAMAENYFQKEKYTQAKSKALEVLPKIQSVSFSEERIALLILLSNIEKLAKNYEASTSYAQQALESAVNPANRISVFNQLAEIYKDNGLPMQALIAKDSVIALIDSLQKMKNGRLFEANKVKFEIANFRRQLQENQQLQKKERNTFYSVLAVLLLVILLITWALRNSYIKNKQRKVLHKRKQEIIALELQKKESDNLLLEKQLHAKEAMSLLEQERLKNELETRNRKLAAKALQLSTRNELVKDIIQSLSGQTEITRNALISSKIKELRSLLKNDSEWENFFTHFEEVNHGFLSNLKEKHPQLTSNDIRFLSYMYMNLTLKEISSLFNITPEATRKRKERISSKINLKDGTSLYNYISSI